MIWQYSVFYWKKDDLSRRTTHWSNQLKRVTKRLLVRKPRRFNRTTPVSGISRTPKPEGMAITHTPRIDLTVNSRKFEEGVVLARPGAERAFWEWALVDTGFGHNENYLQNPRTKKHTKNERHTQEKRKTTQPTKLNWSMNTLIRDTQEQPTKADNTHNQLNDVRNLQKNKNKKT